jgi:amphi-Trp domain-containing protein
VRIRASVAQIPDWLELVSKAFTEGSHVELPFRAGAVSLHVPDHVHAEFEVEVEGGEVEVELELSGRLRGPTRLRGGR